MAAETTPPAAGGASGAVNFSRLGWHDRGAGWSSGRPPPNPNRRGGPRPESPMYKYAWCLVDWVLGLVGVTDVPENVDID